MKLMYYMAAIGLALIVVGVFSAAHAQSDRSNILAELLPEERNTIELFRRHSSSVVFIRNMEIRRDPWRRNVTEIPRGTGTGFVWDKAGHVVTNFHVIQGGNRWGVTLGGGDQTFDAKLVGYDESKDLAVLRIDAPAEQLAPVRTGDSTRLVVGQKVLAIGNPFGLDQTLTTGIISALGREIHSASGRTITDVIQTDASINPGNSGGPLLDSSGRLIGVNTAIYSTSGASAGIGFAVPAKTVRRVIPQLIQHGRVLRPALGIRAFPPDLVRRWGLDGVVIQEVVAGTGAAEAGLKPAQMDRQGRVTIGDVIVEVAGQPISDLDDLLLLLEEHRIGSTVQITLERGGKRIRQKVRLVDSAG